MRKTWIALLTLVALLPGAALAQDRARATTKDAELMVQKAIAYVAKEGKEKALAAFNDPKGAFTYLDLYVYVMDLDGKVLAHGRNQKFVGKNHTNLKDAAGNYHFSRHALELAKAQGKGWYEYRIENPQTGKTEDKVAYIERAGDLVISCGVFRPGAK
jgi:signal transduction histidine kinase